MNLTKEISALLQLMEDPDDNVYTSVRLKLLSLGKEIIPELEHLWETTDNSLIQERAEMLIHQLHVTEVKKELLEWSDNQSDDLIAGLCVFNKYHFPDADSNIIIQKIEKLRRNIWLELNSYLTPLEQTNVLTGFLFHFCSFKKEPMDYQKPADFLLSKLLESKSGNPFIMAILQQVLATLNDVPLHIIRIPDQYILAYCPQTHLNNQEELSNNPSIFVDGGSGQIYSLQHIENYFNKNKIEFKSEYFTPLSNQEIIAWLIEEYANCFATDQYSYKYQELISLAKEIKKEPE
jgi:regulator of sirC expression with transglutaminase-like and TPR domain